MKYTMAATFMAFGLAACGGGGGSDGDMGPGDPEAEARFVEQCVSQTEQSEATCECQKDAMVDVIGAGAFAEILRLAEEGDEAGVEQLVIERLEGRPMAAMQMAAAVVACSGA